MVGGRIMVKWKEKSERNNPHFMSALYITGWSELEITQSQFSRRQKVCPQIFALRFFFTLYNPLSLLLQLHWYDNTSGVKHPLNNIY
jgi:hypothetical protein